MPDDQYRIDPADLDLPPTQPLDISWILEQQRA